MIKKKTNKIADEAAEAKQKAEELAKQSKLIEDTIQKMKLAPSAITTANSNTTGTWHTVAPNYQWNYPTTPQPQPIYQPQVHTPLPHFALGSEEENQELLSMMEALGVEPTDNYLSGIMLVIGENYYSFTELLVKQMQFMMRVNILLCHRGSDDKD